jgi:hypothetical protein
MGLVVAGVLVGVTGCTLDSLSLAVTGGPPSREQTLNGSLDSVSACLQGALHQQGLIFTYSRDDESLRIQSATRTGQKFLLVLKRKKSAAGEQTVVRIDWLKDSDEKFWQSLLEVVGTVQSQQLPPADQDFRPGRMQ